MTSPDQCIPAWLNLYNLDHETDFRVPRLASDETRPIAVAAELHEQALIPATHAERIAILGELRLRTIPRNESDDEARARFRILLEDLEGIPAEVLRRACLAHVASDDGKFYPTASELLKHANPLIWLLEVRARRLRAIIEANRVRSEPQKAALPKPEPWKPEPGEIDRIKAEVAAEIAAKRAA